MKYHHVVTKINKVIGSCILLSQLQMAEKYLKRYITKSGINNYWVRRSLKTYVYDLIKEKIDELYDPAV